MINNSDALTYNNTYNQTVQKAIDEHRTHGISYLAQAVSHLKSIGIQTSANGDTEIFFQFRGFDYTTFIEIEFDSASKTKPIIQGHLVTAMIQSKGKSSEARQTVSDFYFDKSGKIELDEKFKDAYLGYVLASIHNKIRIKI